VPTTIKLGNDSSIEILAFVPMEPVRTNVSQVNASTSPSPNQGLLHFTDKDIEETPEESQRRLVMSALNGFDVSIECENVFIGLIEVFP